MLEIYLMGVVLMIAYWIYAGITWGGLLEYGIWVFLIVCTVTVLFSWITIALVTWAYVNDCETRKPKDDSSSTQQI